MLNFKSETGDHLSAAYTVIITEDLSLHRLYRTRSTGAGINRYYCADIYQEGRSIISALEITQIHLEGIPGQPNDYSNSVTKAVR